MQRAQIDRRGLDQRLLYKSADGRMWSPLTPTTPIGGAQFGGRAWLAVRGFALGRCGRNKRETFHQRGSRRRYTDAGE